MIRRFLRDEAGATAVEYGLLISILSLGLVGALTAVGTGIRQKLFTLATTFAPS